MATFVHEAITGNHRIHHSTARDGALETFRAWWEEIVHLALCTINYTDVNSLEACHHYHGRNEKKKEINTREHNKYLVKKKRKKKEKKKKVLLTILETLSKLSE